MKNSNAHLRHTDASLEGRWAAVLKRLGLQEAELLKRQKKVSRRTYLWAGRIYKIWLLLGTDPPEARREGLRHEFEIIQRCCGIDEIPPGLRYTREDDFELAVYPYRDARPLNRLQPGVWRSMSVFARLTWILARLSWRGVAHNDLCAHNILVAEDGGCSLIDFDHATIESRETAFYRNFIRGHRVEWHFYGSFLRLVVMQGWAAFLRWRRRARPMSAS